jgi:hypothetical protein
MLFLFLTVFCDESILFTFCLSVCLYLYKNLNRLANQTNMGANLTTGEKYAHFNSLAFLIGVPYSSARVHPTCLSVTA